MPKSSRIRTGRAWKRRLIHKTSLLVSQSDIALPRQWEGWAHIATIASATVALVALVAGTYQFSENSKLQRETLALQAAYNKADRSAKAAEFFDRFVQVRSEWNPPKRKIEMEYYLRQRNNKALQFLNAVYSVSKGDESWESVIFWELQKFGHFLRERQLMCLSLTDDFTKFIEKSITELPSNICYDTYDSE